MLIDEMPHTDLDGLKTLRRQHQVPRELDGKHVISLVFQRTRGRQTEKSAPDWLQKRQPIFHALDITEGVPLGLHHAIERFLDKMEARDLQGEQPPLGYTATLFYHPPLQDKSVPGQACLMCMLGDYAGYGAIYGFEEKAADAMKAAMFLDNVARLARGWSSVPREEFDLQGPLRVDRRLGPLVHALNRRFQPS